MHEMMATEEEEEHFNDATFEKRHIIGERMEKQIFTNFISRSNHRKRTHHQSANVSKNSGSCRVHFGSPTPDGDDTTLACPTSYF